ncbi:MAG: head-tail joining protein [Bryobacteraceae bacterium]
MSGWEAAVRDLNAAVVDTFGREILYLPEAGSAAAVRAVFQPAREAEDASPGVYAVLFVRLAELPAAPVRGDEVEIENVRYKVFDIEADSEGAAVLRLRKSG